MEKRKNSNNAGVENKTNELQGGIDRLRALNITGKAGAGMTHEVKKATDENSTAKAVGAKAGGTKAGAGVGVGYTVPLLLCDFYKIVHSDMLNPNMTYSMSYYTPRMSRVKMWDKVANFGMQMFIKKYLIEEFTNNFFNRPEDEVVNEFKRVVDNTLGAGIYNLDKIRKLHRLGYLPIEIISLPEGAMVPIHVPMFGISNTHKEFAWLPQALESLISAELWRAQISATVGKTYREIVDKYYDMTCDDNVSRERALGYFGFRGDDGKETALINSVAWCMSFFNTATVPTVTYLENMFNCDSAKEDVAYGAVSTEHFVMCSNYAIDGDEETFLRKMLTELYPNTSFSAVLDSYDYWNVIDNIIPKLKNEILAHNGCMLMRGDSGDCVEVVTKTVFKLWETFGGTVNSKGYKVLDPHVKAIYGDGITVQRCKKIYEILEKNGFACSNVALGVGSFSMQCIEDTDGKLQPFTRDTFGCAIKACYAEVEINGETKEYPVFKNPKESSFKKSQKGLCYVTKDENGEYIYKDNYTRSTIPEGNLLEVVYKDGVLLKDYTLKEVRENLHNN